MPKIIVSISGEGPFQWTLVDELDRGGRDRLRAVRNVILFADRADYINPTLEVATPDEHS
jgi:hypothetical protein